jgi:hypothetical protein
MEHKFGERRKAMAKAALALATLMGDSNLTDLEATYEAAKYVTSMLGYMVRDEHDELREEDK